MKAIRFLKSIRAARLPLLLIAAAALVVGSGCEHDDTDSYDLSIRLSTHTLRRGERCEARAHLTGNDSFEDSDASFSWSLSDPSLGTLSNNRGRSVEYIPTRFPGPGGKAFEQTIYCKADGHLVNAIFDPDAPLFNHHASQEIIQLPDR